MNTIDYDRLVVMARFLTYVVFGRTRFKLCVFLYEQQKEITAPTGGNGVTTEVRVPRPPEKQ